MPRANEHRIDEAFDDISHQVRKTVSKHEFSLKDCRAAMVSAIDEARVKLKKIDSDKAWDEEAAGIVQSVKDAILDGAEEIKGIGLDIGNIKGDDFDEVSDELVDFAEEEFDGIVSGLISD